MRDRARRSSTGGAAASGDRCGWFTAQQVGAGVGQGEGLRESSHEDVVDAVAPCSLVPLEQGAGAVRADPALDSLDADQGPADPGWRDRVRRVFGEVLLDVVEGR